MTVYHGGGQAVVEPDLVHSRRAVDFGPGFYTTPVLAQAVTWCEKRRRRLGGAVVSRYEFDAYAAESLKVLRFSDYSDAWLDFIVSCRSGKDATDWDLVIGGVANDRVFDTLEAFFDGFATRQQTIDKLRYEKPNMQICFRTMAALVTLKYIGSETV